MKYVPPIAAFLAILFLMALPQRTAQGAPAIPGINPARPEAPLAVTSTPTPLATAVPAATPLPPPSPNLSCLRINFEVSGDVALAGTYEVVEVSGRSLASWEAQAGWQDSGWITNLEISFSAVHVRVVYHPSGGGTPVEMAIMNPAPGTPYGWVARGMCHAVEVGWP